MKPTERRSPVLLVKRLGQIGKAITVATATQISRQTLTPALPEDRWPQWAADIAKQRQPGDTGIGDTLVHLIGDSRSEAFKQRFKELIGSSCGCSQRQAWLNSRFPYQLTTS